MNGGFIQTCLSSRTVDTDRALASLKQEMMLMDRHQELHQAMGDLPGILDPSGQGEEREPGAMVMEWLRRTLPGFDFQIKQHLYAPGGLTVLATRGGAGSPQLQSAGTSS